jgi:hypothetical protein
MIVNHLEEGACAKCKKFVVKLQGAWYAYPLVHGPGSGLIMYEKRICRKGFFRSHPHEVGAIS